MGDRISRWRGMQIEILQGDKMALASGTILWETPFQVINDHFDGCGFCHAEIWFASFVASLPLRVSKFTLEISSTSWLCPNSKRDRL